MDRANTTVGKDFKPEIILGLDVSTACIGCCIYFHDGSDFGKIIKLTQVVLKTKKNITGIEQLIKKKDIFEETFLSEWKDKGITKVVIEEPLISSNNANTVATLLRFNGMISEGVYRILGIIPEYISSHDARLYSFPVLSSVRRYKKNGDVYPKKTIISALKASKVVLFGDYPFDCDKKLIMWNKTSEKYPDVEWLYDKNGKLKKENFDANDALVTCLAISHKLLYGDLNMNVVQWEDHPGEKEFTYTVRYWDKEDTHTISYQE